MATDSLEVIRRRISSGDREGARVALIDFLRTDPDAKGAWALMAVLLKDPAQQVECYRQILRIDPEDRQAAMWLETFSCQIPDYPPREENARPVDSVLTELGGRPLPAVEPHIEGESVDRVLGQLDPTDLDPETRQLLGLSPFIGPSEQGTLPPEIRAEDKGLLDRLVSRFSGSRLEGRVPAGSTGLRGAMQRSRPLTPDEIIQLAGGALSPEERRNCPKCGAVVSRTLIKCPWCSEPLSASEAG
jgi:hypothetical protein